MPSTAANFTAHLNLPGDTPHPTPATLVRPEDTVLLHYNGPAGEHILYSDEEPSGKPVEFPYITQPLTRDSVFTLKSVANGMIRYDSLTVTVDRPALPGIELGELAGGPALTVPVPLTITGHLTAVAETHVTGTCSATAVLASGPVKTSSLNVTGTATGLDGESRLSTDGELEVNGTLQSNESLSVLDGPVEIFDRDIRSGTAIKPYSPAPGDGFIITTPDPDVFPAEVQLTAGVSPDTRVASRFCESHPDGSALAALPIHQGDQLTSTAPDAYYYLIRFSSGS
ncbi:hypothetical protein ACFY0R_09820 [Streptomyces sp. NPDC001633]|uniref:hypothetical protein n=1 Tax=Streptomyces sp. NPDC001633 TaxID=3364595 RepID=UPI0036C8AB7B